MKRLPRSLTVICVAAFTFAPAGALTAQARDGVGASSAPGAMEALRLAYYDYDTALPLNPELKELPNQTEKLGELRTRYHLAFDSVNDQRVTAIFTVPKHFTGPGPALVLVAGSGGHKDTDYIRLMSDMFSTMGYATLSLDAQYHGERSRPGRTGDIHLISSVTNRNAWVQTVIDIRRAVDFLQSRSEVDGKRIGYCGFSQGGMIGGTLLGVEPRVAAAVLAVPGGGFLELGPKLGLVEKENAKTFETNAAITDPIYFIARFAPRPLLMLSAKRDELIPKAASDALFSAAREPKQIIWYDSGHVLPPLDAMREMRAFFQKHLGEGKKSAPAT